MKWLAEKLNCNDNELAKLYSDRFALNFLMTWSLFESRCFNGFIKQIDITSFSNPNVSLNLELKIHFGFFHNRYQDEVKYNNLVHGNTNTFIDNLIGSDVTSISDDDAIRFLIYVVYRYRNNMFHGNKGLQSWVSYKEQIKRCIDIMKNIYDLVIGN